MNIKIELLGYKGTLTHIGSRIADSIWQKEDELLVYISFEEPLPASILETAIAIPVKDYSNDEFLSVIRGKGEKQLAISLEKCNKDGEQRARDLKRHEELKALAKSLEIKFK